MMTLSLGAGVVACCHLALVVDIRFMQMEARTIHRELSDVVVLLVHVRRCALHHELVRAVAVVGDAA